MEVIVPPLIGEINERYKWHISPARRELLKFYVD